MMYAPDNRPPLSKIVVSIPLRRLLTHIMVVTVVFKFASVRGLSTSVTRQLQNPAVLLSELCAPSADTTTTASSSSTKSFEVRDPASPETVLANVPVMDVNDARTAIESAHDALEHWRDGTTAAHRSKLLHQWSQLIHQHANDIAIIMTLESGKPIRESRGEIEYGRSFLDYYAAEAVRPTNAGFLVPTPFAETGTGKPRGQIMAVYQAVGVAALITPWNFPIAMITRKVGPALAAGCTTVLKPSELTPLTALALRNLAIQAGIPESVFQVVTPDRDNTPTVGKEFCTNPLVRKISFTGSTVVGKQLMEWSSGTMKRLSLELGGNAPFIVFDDADLDQAVQAAISSKFRNAGQTCVCADRFLVQSGVHDEFVQRFAEQVRQTYYDGAMGPGLEESNVMGPMISASALENVDQKVQSAIQEGAKCIIGGRRRVNIGPQFYEPTILTHVSKDSLIWKTETFGPVAPIQSFDTEEEALQIANDCRVGLASYFCTRDLSRAFRFAKQLESGLVAMNEGILSTCYAPFGGVKESGLGREGSPLGLQEYLETKYIFMNY